MHEEDALFLAGHFSLTCRDPLMLGSFPLNQLEQTPEICLILSPYVVRLVPLCFFSQRLLSAMPIDTPLLVGSD